MSHTQVKGIIKFLVFCIWLIPFENEVIYAFNIFPFLTAGITLALFVGVRKHSTDQNKVPVRGDIHVIIVGMLKFFSTLIIALK